MGVGVQKVAPVQTINWRWTPLSLIILFNVFLFIIFIFNEFSFLFFLDICSGGFIMNQLLHWIVLHFKDCEVKHLSIYQSPYLYILQGVPETFIYLSIPLSIYLSIYIFYREFQKHLSIYPSPYLFILQGVPETFIYLSFPLSIYLSIYIFYRKFQKHLSIYLFIYPSIYSTGSSRKKYYIAFVLLVISRLINKISLGLKIKKNVCICIVCLIYVYSISILTYLSIYLSI